MEAEGTAMGRSSQAGSAGDADGRPDPKRVSFWLGDGSRGRAAKPCGRGAVWRALQGLERTQNVSAAALGRLDEVDIPRNAVSYLCFSTLVYECKYGNGRHVDTDLLGVPVM